MAPKQRPRAPERWAYAYQLNPPQPEPRFAKVKRLLRRAGPPMTRMRSARSIRQSTRS